MAKKIKVGVCTASMHQLSMHRMINQFCKEASNREYELHIYAPFSNMDQDSDNDRIQQNIYKFMKYDELEAIVFFADMVKNSKVQESIFKIAKNMDIPVIGVKASIEGIYNINYDVNSAIESIVEHLITEHNCKRINFISGVKGDGAFDLRCKAYQSVLNRYNIPFEEDRVLYGGFWSVPTTEALDQYFDNDINNKMPNAFVCANDAMAIATCKYLMEKGYRIPEDVKVTGIGGIRETEFFTPELTTAKYDPVTTSIHICNSLDDILRNGGSYPSTIRIPCEINYTESCGCLKKENRDREHDTITNLYSQLEKERAYRHDTNRIIVATNYDCVIETVLKSIPKYIAPTGISAYNMFLLGEFGPMIGILTKGMEEALPIINLGTLINRKSEELLKPITWKEYNNSIEPIAQITNHVMYIPIHSEKTMYGFMAVNYDYEKLSPEFLYDICVTINLCIDAISKRYNLDEANRQLSLVSEQTIQSLAELVEAKSEVTGLHVKRVSEYTRILARGMGYTEEEINTLRIASMMHDVGKINVPSEILEKPGKLNDTEFAIIKLHVTEGERLLEKSPGAIMEKARIIAKQHHEKWDGTGYLGMKGEQIDTAARIVALADVFDALVSRRPYKPALDIETAKKIIINDSGTHFDPEVVKCFIDNLDEFIKTLDSYVDEVVEPEVTIENIR